MTGREVGMWAWGGVTVALAAGFLGLVLAAGCAMEQTNINGQIQFVFKDAPRHLPGLFYAVKENGSLVAGILGFSGIAWAHFYSGGSKSA